MIIGETSHSNHHVGILMLPNNSLGSTKRWLGGEVWPAFKALSRRPTLEVGGQTKEILKASVGYQEY